MKNKIFNIYISSIIILTIIINIKINAQNFDQVQKIVASDRFTYDNFGSSVAIYGDFAVVGAPLEDQDSNGENWISAAGSAYVYEKDTNGDWNQIQKLSASSRNTNNKFGYSVACSEDIIVISAYLEDIDGYEDCGTVYIFSKQTDGTWTQKQKLIAPDKNTNDYFGYSISISNNYLVIGAYNAYVDGNNKAGAAYIYKQNEDETWSATQKISASDNNAEDYFGYSVSIDQNHILIGAEGEDEDQNQSNYIDFAGSAYIFELNTESDTWNQMQKIVSSDRQASDCFGHSVAISGNYAIIGAYKEDEDVSGTNTLSESGSAYIFKCDNSNNWSQIQKIVAPDRNVSDNFGNSVALCNNLAAIGSRNEDEDALETNPTSESGSAYCFKLNESGTWNLFQKIKASDYEETDVFGSSVSISGNNIFIGAYLEDHDADGLNTKSEAGSAYIFNLTNSYVIFSSCNTGGTIDPLGYYTLIDSESITYNFTPDDNYEINSILINSASIPTIQSSITMSDLTSDKTIEVIYGVSTAIINPSSIDEIILYPNPTKDQLTITTNTSTIQKSNTVQIINFYGQIIKTIQLNNYESNTISVSELTPGTYFIKTKNHQAVKFTKI